MQQDLGEYDAAERSYLQALESAAPATKSRERLAPLCNLGTLYLNRDDYSKGERIRKEIEELPPGTLNDNPAQAGGLLNVLAGLEHQRHRDRDAERLYVEALKLLRQVYGPVSVDAANVRANLAFIGLETGRYEDAAAMFRQAIHEIEIAASFESPWLVRPLVNLARCENRRGRSDLAEPAARRAVALAVRTFGEAHRDTATGMLEYAAALRGLGRRKPARELEKRARATLQNSFKNDRLRYTVSLRDLTAGAPIKR